MRTCHILTSLLVVLLVSCHTTRQTARTEREVTDTGVTSHHDYSDLDRQQSWRTLTLELDSFELWLPTAADTLTCLTDEPATVATSLTSLAAGAGVRLRARHATLSSGTATARSHEVSEQSADSIRHQCAVDVEQQEAADRVAVTKPPDIPWATMGVIVAIAAAVAVGYRIYRKRR